MMDYEARGYQRRYLRAPYKHDILYVDQDFIHKGQALNISEGGMLLDRVGHFPETNEVLFMVKLPQFPLFKNFTLERLKNYNLSTLEAKVIRFKAKMVRKIKTSSRAEGILLSQMGLQIQDIDPFSQAKISNYVDTFASNLIYLQVLIDSINDDKNNLTKIRIIANYLGYEKDLKISYLRTLVEHDYKSLQWL